MIEALKQALEALEEFGNHDNVCPQWPTYAEPEKYPKCNCGYADAITSLRQAIAEAEKCEWQGLTDEEKSELWEVSRAALPRYATYASLVEAKLKEKNHG